MDRVFSICPHIAPQSYELVANGCLLLAAKFEELDMNIPMVFDFQLASKFRLSYHAIKGVESELLLLLDFDLMALTPLHFLNAIHASGFLTSNDCKATGQDVSEKTLFKVKEYAYFFCDEITEHYNLIQQFKPSLLASVCVYFARKCCQLTTIWDKTLSDFIGYTLSDMAPVIVEFEKSNYQYGNTNNNAKEERLASLVQYAIDNCREGDALKFNRIKRDPEGKVVY